MSGPGSTVTLRTHAQTDLAGNDYVLAVADYDSGSRPSTPGKRIQAKHSITRSVGENKLFIDTSKVLCL